MFLIQFNMMITRKFMLGVCVCAAPTVAYVSCDSNFNEKRELVGKGDKNDDC